MELNKELLELITYAIGIVGSVIAGVMFLWRAYRGRIETQRKSITRSWTNEGVAFGNSDEALVTLHLTDHHGDIIGQLEAPSLDRPLEAHLTPGWPKATLTLSFLNRTGVQGIATAKLKIVGNNNRIAWKLVKGGIPELPKITILWPHGNA